MTVAGEIPTIVLVHGAWADATGFDPEIRALRDRGFTAIGFALPTVSTVASYVDVMSQKNRAPATRRWHTAASTPIVPNSGLCRP